VTVPIEKEVNGIPHSKPPRSVSIFGLSVVTIVFDDAADAYSARQQVLERISQADLPDNVEPELDPNTSPVGEVFRYTIQGSHWSSMDKKEVQDLLMKELCLNDAVRVALVSKMNAVIVAALVAAVGLMPAAFSTGIGSQSQKPFATVIAFDILPSTLLALLLLPAMAPICLRIMKRRQAIVSETASETESAI